MDPINNDLLIEYIDLLNNPKKIKELNQEQIDYISQWANDYISRAVKKLNMSTVKKGFDNDYISLVTDIINDLDISESGKLTPLNIDEYIVIKSIYKTKELNYKLVTNRAIEEVEAHARELLDICSLEVCDNDYLFYHYVSFLIEKVLNLTYKIFNPLKQKEYDNKILKLEKNLDKHRKNTDGEDFRRLLYNYIELFNDREEQIYKYNKKSNIALEILDQLIPNNQIPKNIALELKYIEDDFLKGSKSLMNIPKTKYPDEFITPKDKISNMLFNGELSEELRPLRMERLGSKKELTAKVSIGLDELKNVQLSNTSITPYDREVHDAIVSLYVDGGNEFITPLMIYRTMTGNPGAKLTDKITKDISDALERCSITRVYIDATDEVNGKGYNIEQPIYKENLLYIRSIQGMHNGEMGEWIQIIQPPILYRYASTKNQVARMDIKLLNTPVNKNEETIILQGYLQRRILSMKGSNLSRNIKYETVYKQLNIKSASPGALRKKQTKIRDTIKNILDYWKEELFIEDYKENAGANNSKLSISIKL